MKPGTRVRWTHRSHGKAVTMFGHVLGPDTDNGKALVIVRQEDSTRVHILDPDTVAVLSEVTAE